MACESVERLTEYDVQTIAFAHYPAWTDDANGVLAGLAKRARADGGTDLGSGPARNRATCRRV